VPRRLAMPSYSTTLVPLACRYPIDICNSTPSKGKYVLISHKGIEATPHIQYGISVKMLKGTALSITPVLTGLFSMSIESGIFPFPSVLPIPKGGQTDILIIC